MKSLFEKHCVTWGEREWLAAQRFREALTAGNAVQNLTRLTGEEDFFWGHLWDVYQLAQSGWLGSISMDLGSGCGVPGLLHATLFPEKRWILSESEKRKAGFLEETRLTFHLNQVEVVAHRAEQILARKSVDDVVVRAVGPISRIWTWIGKCSTWNSLILFKGPSWASEWEEFQVEYPNEKLTLLKETEYIAYSKGEKRERKLLLLTRGR